MKNLKLLLVAPLAALILSSVAYGAQRPGPDVDGGWEESKSDETVAIGGSMAAASEVEMASSDVWSIIDARFARRNRFRRDRAVPLWILIQIAKLLSFEEVVDRLEFFCCDGLDLGDKEMDPALKIKILEERRALKSKVLHAALEDRDPEEDTTPDETLLRVKKKLRNYKVSINEAYTRTHECIDAAIAKIDAIYTSHHRKKAFNTLLAAVRNCYSIEEITLTLDNRNTTIHSLCCNLSPLKQALQAAQKHGVDILSRRDFNGMTILHYLSREWRLNDYDVYNTELIKDLLKPITNKVYLLNILNLRDRNGKTAEELARSGGNDSAADVFQHYIKKATGSESSCCIS